MSSKNRKIPKALSNPIESKTPKTGVILSDNNSPDFKPDQMDLDGPWGWTLDAPNVQEVFKKILESQKLSWQELRNNGSHFVNIKSLCPQAQKRLIIIKKEDLDELFSLRLTGKKRIWGIKEGNIFWMLWWDPNHEVCPSYKRNT